MKNKTKINREVATIEALFRTIRPFPGEDFQRRMDLAPWKLNDKHDQAQLRVRRLIKLAGIMAVAALLIGLAFSPVGRVLAEEIIQFFNQIIGNTLPLPPDQILEPVPTSTPQPTYYPALLPADQAALPEEDTSAEPEPTPQLDPAYLQDMDSMSARALVDFPLLEPAYLPQGYQLQNIHFDDTRQVLSMTYGQDASMRGLMVKLSESHNPFDLQFPEDSGRETISVAGKVVERYSRVGQSLPDGADEILLWEQDGVSLTLAVHYRQDQSETVYQREDWLAVIEGLTTCPVSGSTKDYACEVNRAAVAAGFIPWQFPQAPESYSFKSVYYIPGMTAIWYASPAGELGLLQSTEDFKTQETSDWFSVPADAIQEVIVAGRPAEYVAGDFVANPGEDHAVWNPDTGHIRLRWKQADWWFQFVKWGSPHMQPQELADLAADLTADPALFNADLQVGELNQITMPDAYLTIADAEKAYGEGFLQPEILPQNLPFSHARLSEDGTILLFYGDFAEDKMRANDDVLTFAQGPKGQSFEETYEKNYPQEAITDAQVNGHPAKLISGTIQMSYDENGQLLEGPTWKIDPFMLALYWEEGELNFVLRFSAGAQSGTRLDAPELIEIAESLHE